MLPIFLLTSIFILAPSLAVIILLSRIKSLPLMLDDTFKSQSTPLSKSEINERTKGSYIDLGKDKKHGQNFVLSEAMRFKNAAIAGGIGVGKTSQITSTFLAQDIKRGDNAIVVFDGQRTELSEEVIALCKLYNREIVILPYAGFNPLNSVGRSEDRAELFANLLGQVSGVAASDSTAGKYFLEQEQTFIRKVVPLFERAYAKPMILREVYLLAKSDEYRKKLVADAGLCVEAEEFSHAFDSWSLERWEHTLSGLCSFIDGLLVGDRKHWYSDRFAPTLANHIEAKRVIIIREGGIKASTDKTLGLLFMINLQEYARKRVVKESAHFIGAYMDEVYMYFNPSFPDFISQSRKRRIALHLGFQSFQQFGEYKDIVLTSCKTWVIHGGLSHDDSIYVADQIGERFFKERSTSRSQGSLRSSQSESLSRKYLIQPERIAGMGEDECLLLTLRGRETDAVRTIAKTAPIKLDVEPFEEPEVLPTSYRVPLIWDELRVFEQVKQQMHDEKKERIEIGVQQSEQVIDEVPDWS